MLARRTARRSAFTIVELMVVLAIVLLLAAIMVPTLMGFWGNNKTKAAVDLVTGRLSDARGSAITHGRAYRVSTNPDGTQIRVAPDESESPEEVVNEAATGELNRTDDLPKGVVLTPMSTTADVVTDGWTTLAVFLPDGTCRDALTEFRIAETDGVAQVVRVRGLTGVWTVNPENKTSPTTMGGQP